MIGEDILLIRPRNKFGRLGLYQVWESRHLLKFFILRTIKGRYRPTSMGYGWIFLRPALLCLVYVAVFGHIAGIRTAEVPFPLFVFLGVSLYVFFSGAVSDIASSLAANAAIISKVYYPRLIVPLNSLFVNILDLLASFLVVIVLMIFYRVTPAVEVFYFPLFLFGFVLFTFSLGLALAAYSVKFRDIAMGLPVVLRVLIYAMPCVYPVSLIPHKFLTLYYLNPLASFVQGMRWALWGEVCPPMWTLMLGFIVSFLILIYGLIVFTEIEGIMVDSL